MAIYTIFRTGSGPETGSVPDGTLKLQFAFQGPFSSVKSFQLSGPICSGKAFVLVLYKSSILLSYDNLPSYK
jgi:hypothetical protein